MALSEKDLLRIKKKIEDDKQQLSRLSGQKEYLMKELKEKWGCSTVEQAKKKIDKYDSEAEELRGKIEKEAKELEDEYGPF